MDFIDRMRKEAEAKVQRPRQLEPWEIERQREHEEWARKVVIGEKYLHESGCVAYGEKLADFLNSQNQAVKAFSSIENRYMGKDEGSSLEFYWHPQGVQHNFKVVAKLDGSLVFTGRTWPDKTTCTVPLSEWRNNKQAIDRAFEMVYSNPQVWDEDFRRSFRG